MTITVSDLFLPFLLCVGIGILAYLFFQSNTMNKNLKQWVKGRGITGQAGSPIYLSCPTGSNIKITSGTVLCSVGNADQENQICDPIDISQTSSINYGSFNPNTTQDIVSTLEQQCQGQNSCAVTIPTTVQPCTANSGPCPSGTTAYVIGTYVCE
jgi:hypothetical protein